MNPPGLPARILESLSHGETTAQELADEFGTSEANVLATLFLLGQSGRVYRRHDSRFPYVYWGLR